MYTCTAHSIRDLKGVPYAYFIAVALIAVDFRGKYELISLNKSLKASETFVQRLSIDLDNVKYEGQSFKSEPFENASYFATT